MKWLKWLLVLLGILWSLSALLPHFQRDRLEVWMLNVGQGESILVREPSGKLLLYDGGPDESVLQQLGSVLPPWQRRIDLIILSHDHTDHLTGLISILQRYQVGEIWASGATYKSPEYHRFIAEISERHIPKRNLYFNIEQCQESLVCPIPITFGQASLQVYHPLFDMAGAEPHQPHDATLSVKASYRGQSVFLTGDLDEQHEQSMIDACQQPRCTLNATLLQVPHHGSATGLLDAFLRSVGPHYALFPVGLNNKFNFPRPEILTKLQIGGVPFWRTDLNGRIHASLGGSKVTVQPEHPG